MKTKLLSKKTGRDGSTFFETLTYYEGPVAKVYQPGKHPVVG